MDVQSDVDNVLRSLVENFPLSNPNQIVNCDEKLLIIRDTLYNLFLSLYADEHVPRSTVEIIAKNISFILKYFMQMLNSFFENRFNDDFFEFLSSEKKFVNFMKEKSVTIECKEILIDESNEISTGFDNSLNLEKMSSKLLMNDVPGYLEYLFNSTNYLRDFFEFRDSLNTDKYVKECDPVNHFLESKFWRQKVEQINELDQKTLLLPFIIFSDDFEVNNPLGSHSNVQKLTGFYGSLACLPNELSSKLNEIIFVMIHYAQDSKSFENARMLSNLVEMCKKLFNDGVVVKNNPFFQKVRIVTVIFNGDNLGLQSLLGFMGLNSSYPCRFCLIKSDDMKKNTCLVADSRSLYPENLHDERIKEKSILNEIPFFSIFKNLAVDKFHDFYEGIVRYDLLLILNILCKEKIVTIPLMNQEMLNFNYNPSDKKNKPPLLNLDCLKNKTFRLSGHETKIFVHNFGLYIGKFVSKTSEAWSLYIYLRKILSLVNRRSVSKRRIEELRNLIQSHHKLYVKLGGNLTLKFHYVLHYPDIMSEIGSVILTETIRYESFHQPIKKTCFNSQNRINLLKTVSSKMFYRQTFNFLNNQRLRDLKSNFGKSSEDPEKQIEKTFNFFLQGSYEVLTFFSYGSYVYKNGIVMELDHDDTLCPLFGLVEAIIKFGDRILFCCQGLNYFGFDSVHYYAHNVGLGTTRFAIDFTKIANKKSYVMNKVLDENFINTE